MAGGDEFLRVEPFEVLGEGAREFTPSRIIARGACRLVLERVRVAFQADVHISTFLEDCTDHKSSAIQLMSLGWSVGMAERRSTSCCARTRVLRFVVVDWTYLIASRRWTLLEYGGMNIASRLSSQTAMPRKSSPTSWCAQRTGRRRRSTRRTAACRAAQGVGSRGDSRRDEEDRVPHEQSGRAAESGHGCHSVTSQLTIRQEPPICCKVVCTSFVLFIKPRRDWMYVFKTIVSFVKTSEYAHTI